MLQQVSIRMSMVHIELLCHRRAFSLPRSDQDKSAILQSSFCTHIQELCPFARKIHACVTYPIRDTPFVSRMPCRNILSLVRACATGWGGQRNGSLANGLPATTDRNIMGLMSLSSSCARSVDLTCDVYCPWLIIIMWTP